MLLIDNHDINDPAINLALEEFCVRHLDMSNDYMLFYINDPSIIIGKHQNTIEEINADFVNKNNIHLVRRISGGGAVYHDKGNLNFSFMTKYSQSSIHNFKLFTGPVIRVLKELGISAELNGRNDITVNERKISGNAQFTDTKSMFSHGTLLFDSNIENIVSALNVKDEKIMSKGIKSVKSRVANIKEFLNEEISIHEFKKRIIESIYAKTGMHNFDLTPEQWKAVHELSESKYRSWDWNYGRSPEFNVQKIKRFDFGQIDARIYVIDGIVKDLKLYGDFLGHGEIKDVERIIIGTKYEYNSISEILRYTDLTYYIGISDPQEFARFLTS